MSSIKFEDEERFREPEEQDVKGGTPPSPRGERIFEDGIKSGPTGRVPKSAIRPEKSIAERLREEYGGDGYAAIDKRDGSVIGIAGDSFELMQLLDESTVPETERHVVSLHE